MISNVNIVRGGSTLKNKHEFHIVDLHSTTQKPLSKQVDQLAIATKSKIDVIKISEIILLEADSNYTQIYLQGYKKLLLSKTLKRFEERLDNSQFLRVHCSYLVNINHLVRYDIDHQTLLLTDGRKVPVSRSKKSNLMKYLKCISI